MTALETFRQTYGIPGDVGMYRVPSAGRNDLARLFNDLGYVHGVEIGTWQGRFAEKLCHQIPNLRLICVDPWSAYPGYVDGKNNQERLDEAYKEARRRLKRFKFCSIWRATSFAAASLVPDKSLDFVYIDGNHAKQYVLQDLRAWTKKVRSGGIVAGHDYTMRSDKPLIEVQDAVDEFVADKHIQMFILAADKSPSFFWVKP